MKKALPLYCLFLTSLFTFGLVSQAAVPFTQRQIDEAMSVPDIDYNYYPGSGSYWPNDILMRAPAFYFIALCAMDDPSATDSNGKTVATRSIEHIRSLIAGGNEPYAIGGTRGWCDGQTALALALARQTPTVWNALTSTEQDKVTWIMKALTVAAHWTLDADFLASPSNNVNLPNHPNSLMNSSGERYLLRTSTNKVFKYGFAPNHHFGNTASMVAAEIFFGGKVAVDNLLGSNFNKADYMAKFNQYGFTILSQNWEISEADMNAEMARVGSHNVPVFGWTNDLGSWSGYLNWAFRYKGFNPTSLIQNDWTNTNPDGILLNGSSPYVGEGGYMFELRFGSTRSSARYAYDGWRNLLAIRATLQAIGEWGGDSWFDTQNSVMKSGTEDMLYKLAHGYKGASTSNNPTGPHFEFGTNLGYPYLKNIWRYYVQTDLTPQRDATVGVEAESYDSTNNSGESVGAINLPGASGRTIQGLNSGDWVEYYDIDFGGSVDTVEFNYACNQTGATLDLEVGGVLVDTLALQSTGGLNVYQSMTYSLSSILTGEETVRLIFQGSGEICRMDWMLFSYVGGSGGSGDIVAFKSKFNSKYVDVKSDLELGYNGGTSVDIEDKYEIVSLGGNEVAFIAQENGNYVRCDTADGNRLKADSNTLGLAETFTIVDLGSGYIAIMAEINGLYLRTGGGDIKADSTGTNDDRNKFEMETISASNDITAALFSRYANEYLNVKSDLLIGHSGGSTISADDEYEMLDLGRGEVAFIALSNGSYVRCDTSDGNRLKADSTILDTASTFTLVDLGTGYFAISSNTNGLYLRVGGGAVKAESANYSSHRNQFELQILTVSNDPTVAILSQHSAEYLTVDTSLSIGLLGGSTVEAEDRFTMIDLGNNEVAFVSESTGNYARCDTADASRIKADSTTRGTNETFILIDLGAGLSAIQAKVNLLYFRTGGGGVKAESTGFSSTRNQFLVELQ